MTHKLFITIITAITVAFAANAYAEDYVLTLKDHTFTPQNLVLPAGQKIKLTVKNEQSTPAEFESAELNREKVVEANGQIIVNLGPLDAGTYKFFDDFHRETAGVITAK
jgi:hypothetical protein